MQWSDIWISISSWTLSAAKWANKKQITTAVTSAVLYLLANTLHYCPQYCTNLEDRITTILQNGTEIRLECWKTEKRRSQAANLPDELEKLTISVREMDLSSRHTSASPLMCCRSFFTATIPVSPSASPSITEDGAWQLCKTGVVDKKVHSLRSEAGEKPALCFVLETQHTNLPNDSCQVGLHLTTRLEKRLEEVLRHLSHGFVSQYVCFLYYYYSTKPNWQPLLHKTVVPKLGDWRFWGVVSCVGLKGLIVASQFQHFVFERWTLQAMVSRNGSSAMKYC